MTVLTAGARTDHAQLPTIASNVCTTDARPGVPPKKILATHGFIVLSCSARRLKFVLCTYSCFEGMHNFALSPCDVFMLSVSS